MADAGPGVGTAALPMAAGVVAISAPTVASATPVKANGLVELFMSLIPPEELVQRTSLTYDLSNTLLNVA